MKLFLHKKKKKNDTYQTDFFNFIILKKDTFNLKRSWLKNTKYHVKKAEPIILRRKDNIFITTI